MAKLKYDAKRRRALNMVWDTSADYRFQPDFLAYGDDGAPDLYLNAVEGFTRKYYDTDQLHAMFQEMENSALVDTFTDLLWLGLEYATYAKEAPVRPVLPQLRQEHARAYFNGTLADKHGVAHEMQAARWHEVLGEKNGLIDPWAKALYQSLAFDPSWDTATLCDHFRKLTKKYFVSHFLVRESLEKVIIGKGLGDFLSWIVPQFAKKQESIFNFLYSKQQAEDLLSGKHAHNGLMAIITGQTAAQNYDYIIHCFGTSIYPPQKQLEIDQACCVGVHKGCHLHFTRGHLGSKGSTGEASLWLQGARRQRVRNLAYYKEHGEKARQSIIRLTQQIRSAMRLVRTKLPVPVKAGELVPSLVWRAAKLQDPRVFYNQEVVATPDFTVDIMLDASASRGEAQPVIASQAFVIAEALRGARQLMGDFSQTKKILIMLTDAQPNDDRPFRKEGSLYQPEYREGRAVADTADEAAALRREGIRIIGLINDEVKGGMEDARKIFGKDCIRIHELDKMAESMGKILCRQIESL